LVVNEFESVEMSSVLPHLMFIINDKGTGAALSGRDLESGKRAAVWRSDVKFLKKGEGGRRSKGSRRGEGRAKEGEERRERGPLTR
jgi:hypothetical protein